MIRAEVYRIRRKKGYGQKIWTIIGMLLLAFIVLSTINSIFLSSIAVSSDSNQPSILKGDRFLSTPLIYGASIPFTSIHFGEISKPQRGDLVVFDMRKAPPGFPIDFFQKLISFFSLGFLGKNTDYQGKEIYNLKVKRIIGIPGDKIYLTNFRAYIQPKDGADFIEETQLINKDYPVNTGAGISLPQWNDEYPFSGRLNTILLDENQYFLLGDNRMESIDSLTLGPVEKNQIESKIFFRFWPLNRIGFP